VRAGDEITNPLTGERIVFRVSASESDGRLLELDSFWRGPGHRVAEHIHPGMQESWKVISGTASFRIAGAARSAGPGEVVIAEPGVAHRAWNPGQGLVGVRIQMRPALRWEDFIERLFGIAQSAHAEGLSVPRPAALAELMSEFRAEIKLP
jgi:quercetin dioxygenase-like cupin family protein